MNELRADLEHALAALQAASQVLRRHAAAKVPFELKDGWSPVTAADREVDALLREMLPSRGDGWLSEESDDDETRLACGRVWIVDPIDGTRAFIAARPEYSVSIGLCVDGEPVLGAVGNPATGVIVAGGPGLGLVVEGSPQLAFCGPREALRVLASRSERRRGEWVRHEREGVEVLPMGSVAYSLALVAAGAADATWTLQQKHEWDVAAGTALVRAAGGEVWLPSGGAVRWNSRSPRFPSFAASGPGHRPRAEAALAGH